MTSGLTAIALIFGYLWALVTWFSWQGTRNKQDGPANRCKYQTQQGSPEFGAIITDFRNSQTRCNSYEAKQLHQTTRQANATWAAALIAAVALVISFIGAYFIYGTLATSVQNAAAAGRQADAATYNARAWIDVLLNDGWSLTWDKDQGAVVQTFLTGINYGNSPAVDASFYLVLKMRPFYPTGGIGDNALALSVCSGKEATYLSYTTIFTKEKSGPYRFDGDISWSDIQAWFAIIKRANPSAHMTFIGLLAIACARYRVIGEMSWHYTGRVFTLVPGEAKTLAIWKDLPPGELIPYKDIVYGDYVN